MRVVSIVDCPQKYAAISFAPDFFIFFFWQNCACVILRSCVRMFVCVCACFCVVGANYIKLLIALSATVAALFAF